VFNSTLALFSLNPNIYPLS